MGRRARGRARRRNGARRGRRRHPLLRALARRAGEARRREEAHPRKRAGAARGRMGRRGALDPTRQADRAADPPGKPQENYPAKILLTPRPGKQNQGSAIAPRVVIFYNPKELEPAPKKADASSTETCHSPDSGRSGLPHALSRVELAVLSRSSP